MANSLYRSIMSLAVLTVILCGLYPFGVTVVGGFLFHDKASGSLITREGKIVGSELIAQGFSHAEYFQPRPSVAGEKGYDAANSSGSNLGPTNKKLFERIKGDAAHFLKGNPSIKPAQIPIELMTTSGSGLDPEISPDGALVQVKRVSLARHVSTEQVSSLIVKHTRDPDWGFLGMARVNVLQLNLELDQAFPVVER